MSTTGPSIATRKMAVLRAKRKAAHQCFMCGDLLPESETRQACEACRARHALALSQRYFRLIAKHACVTCGAIHTTRYVRCQDCHEHNKLGTLTARHVADSLAKQAAVPAEEAMEEEAPHV